MSDPKGKIIDEIRKGKIDLRRGLLGINLESQNLQEMNFKEAVMMGSSFSKSNLKGAVFLKAVIMGADFSDAVLAKTDFRYSSAMGAHFDRADLNEADLRYASLGGAFFPNAICLRADFRASTLSGAIFENANMVESRLEDAIFTEACLVNAKMMKATVKNTDFTRADLLGADLHGITFDERTLRSVVNSYNWDKAHWDEKEKAKATQLFDASEKKVEIPEDTSPHRVYVKCRTCGVEFYAGIVVNPRSFATSVFRGNIHQCPNGHRHAYDKEDYVLKKMVKDTEQTRKPLH